MKHDLEYQLCKPEVGVYECEIHLKFRMIEEKDAMGDRESLLEMLIDAFSSGIDDYMEPIQISVDAQEVPDVEASPQMRRRLIRLRNSKDMI